MNLFFKASITREELFACVLCLVGFFLLPWYAIQEGSVFLQENKPWLYISFLGLLICIGSVFISIKQLQSAALIAGASLGLLSILIVGFAIGPRGWRWQWLQSLLDQTVYQQSGMGWGALCVLLAFIMLLGIGIAKRGYFKDDLFVAIAVLLCSSLMTLFILYPVCKALFDAFYTEDGLLSAMAIVDRVFNERNWGLACLQSNVRCGVVAWNTLFLALMVALSTTVLGTLMALMSERTGKRFQKPLNVLALLPIITPTFVVGLGLILLFGRAGVVNQALEWMLGITPSRWFYGCLGVWIAQTFAFTPIAFMIMRGVVQGVAPIIEEASQTLQASPHQHS